MTIDQTRSASRRRHRAMRREDGEAGRRYDRGHALDHCALSDIAPGARRGLDRVRSVPAKRWPAPHSWILLVLGTLGAIAASITGLISHFPYEETDLHGVIETHQWWSFGVTALFIGLTVWRWTSRRNGRDAGEPQAYREALSLTTNEPERRYLCGRLAEVAS